MKDYTAVAKAITDAINDLLAEGKKLDQFTKGRIDARIETALFQAFDDGLAIGQTMGGDGDIAS